MTDRQWLYLPEIKQHFHCPADAVDAWKARGWQDSEPPAEPNSALVEYVPNLPPSTEETADPPQPEPKSTPRRGPATPKNPEEVTDRG